MSQLRMVETPDSSSIAAFGFQESEGKLTVKFKTGATYEFLNVPQKIYLEMCEAASVGKFFNTRVKGNFSSDRLTD